MDVVRIKWGLPEIPEPELDGPPVEADWDPAGEPPGWRWIPAAA